MNFSSIHFKYYLPALKAAKMREPSTPCQTPTSNGIPYAEPHVSFWVEKPFKPQWAAIVGKV